MGEIALQEAAVRTGRAYALLKKHAQRGKLKIRRDGARVLVDEADLEAYVAAEDLGATTAVIASEPTADGFRDLGNLLGRLPPQIQTAILEGIPQHKGNSTSSGSPEPFLKAMEKLVKAGKTNPPAMIESDDPHFGRPIGYQHTTNPRWKRVSESTWELDGASYAWTGIWFEGGGLREGRIVELPITPAHPEAARRPSAPSKPVKR